MMIRRYGRNIVNFDKLEYAVPTETNSGIEAIKLRFVSGHSFILIGDHVNEFLKDAALHKTKDILGINLTPPK